MCHLPISLIGEAMNFEIAKVSFGSNRQLRHFIIGLSALDLCRFCEIGSQSDSINFKSIQNERLFKLTECQLEHCWVWMTDINFPFELVHLTAPRWNFPDWSNFVSVSKTCFVEIRSLTDYFTDGGADTRNPSPASSSFKVKRQSSLAKCNSTWPGQCGTRCLYPIFSSQEVILILLSYYKKIIFITCY